MTATGDRSGPVVDVGPDEAAALSGLALRSKGYWGYDAAFLDACRAELTLTPDQAAAARVVERPTAWTATWRRWRGSSPTCWG